MSIISIIALVIAAHSVIMIFVILFNPVWYESKAIAAGITPNITSAIITKIIIGCIGVGVGYYFM